MYQRQLLRPLARDAAALSLGPARLLHVSARRCADAPSNGGDAKPAPSAAAPRETLRTRSRQAAGQILNLQRKPPAQAGSAAPGTVSQPGGLRIIRQMVDSPPGRMVRAPANLRITRNATGPSPGPDGSPDGTPSTGAPRFPMAKFGGPRPPGGPRPSGPRPAGGARKPGGGSKGPGGREQGPKKRDKKSGPKREEKQDVKVEDTLSDGMVQQLLRLQRKEWDCVPYEPKYAGAAALELIETGKALFRGEKPSRPREPSLLEKRIGIVGMHGSQT